uniref:Putative secreted protein n=1 Tax=Anopheles marajoara TaxID=58244 RepID=A0A2M4CD59_9DIPT
MLFGTQRWLIEITIYVLVSAKRNEFVLEPISSCTLLLHTDRNRVTKPSSTQQQLLLLLFVPYRAYYGQRTFRVL